MTMNMRFFIIAAAATLLAACTQENEVQNNPVEARITAGAFFFYLIFCSVASILC